MLKEDITLVQELKVTPKTAGFLKEIAGWTTFFSILGFIGLGLLVLLALLVKFVFGNALANLPSTANLPFNAGNLFAVLYLVFAFIYYFPIMYLYKFSTKMKKALYAKDDDVFTDAFEMLKSHYKFVGVFTIILISLYILLFVAVIILGASSI